MQDLKFHHFGVPTDVPREGEVYQDQIKMYVTDSRTNPYGIEWLRFEPDCPLPKLIQTVPHIGFEVPDLAAAIEGKQVLIGPNNLGGASLAFIVHDGVPIELVQLNNPEE